MNKLLRVIPLLFMLLVSSAAEDTYLPKNAETVTEEKLTEEDKVALAKFFAKDKIRRIDSLVTLANKKNQFHGAVLVSSKGRILYSGAVGTANFETKEALSPKDVFQLASVSKQFTGVAVMMLAEKGKIDYDAEVRDYIPGFPYRYITVRHLLNHTSGLPNYFYLVEHKWKGEGIPGNDDVLNLLKKHTFPLYFRPGTRYDYSNTGYVVLASIVEKVSGQRFDEFMSENVFEPLDMKNSFVYSSAYEKEYPARLKGYYKRGWRYWVFEEDLTDGAVGDKNVYSTLDDLHKWDMGLYSDKLLKRETLEEGFSPVEFKRKKIPYGFGFRLMEQQGRQVIYHNGLWHGFKTGLARFVEDSSSVILLSHANCAGKSLLQHQLEQIALEESIPGPTQQLVYKVLNEGVEGALDALAQIKEQALENSLQELEGIENLFLERGKLQTAQRVSYLRQRIRPVIAGLEGQKEDNPPGLVSVSIP